MKIHEEIIHASQIAESSGRPQPIIRSDVTTLGIICRGIERELSMPADELRHGFSPPIYGMFAGVQFIIEENPATSHQDEVDQDHSL